MSRYNISLPDLVLTPQKDLAKKYNVSPLEINAIIDTVCKSNPIQALTLAELFSSPKSYGICTSGDPVLDVALGGGFRTGMIWEVVGERLTCIPQLDNPCAKIHSVVLQAKLN